jgi:hypothetical protein
MGADSPCAHRDYSATMQMSLDFHAFLDFVAWLVGLRR